MGGLGRAMDLWISKMASLKGEGVDWYYVLFQ